MSALSLNRKYLPILSTVVIAGLMFAGASLYFDNFFKLSSVISPLNDYAFLGIVAIGLTFVILSGGIDLSVGAAIAFYGVVAATLLGPDHNWPPLLVMLTVLALSTVGGAIMGGLIGYFELAPFLITLGGMFLYRGGGLVISDKSISITNETYRAITTWTVPLGADGPTVGFYTVIFCVALLVAVAASLLLPFGRNVYAVGGNENSANLLGVRVVRTKILIYALSGFYAGLGSIAWTLYTLSGNGLAAPGLELEAISVVVIGGTLLTGGTGYIIGTLLGLFVFGLIGLIITRSNQDSWWGNIIIGGLLLAFILLQKVTQRK